MTEIKNWLFGVIAVCALLSVLEPFAPKGKFKTIFRCSGGIILLLTLLQPLLQTDWSELSHAFSDWKWELDEESTAYQNQQTAEVESIIEEKTAAYIEEKAASLGVVCHAKIHCLERDGVPFPSEIAMDIVYSSQLSQLIEDDLGIPAEDQHWQEVAE